MNKDIRIIFMGTPVFATSVLKMLIAENYNVVAVVCQPDKLVGRKQVLTFCDVKKCALEYNIPVLQPQKISHEYQEVLDYQPDLIITCAYGQFIPKALLDYPRLGCVNVHGSLLPKLRGGAPIQHAIIDGYQTTGMTIMEMDEKMDSGAIISQKEIAIEIKDTYRTLHNKLMDIAASLLKDTMASIIEQSYQPIKQQDSEVTFGMNISKEEEKIDLKKSYMQVYNQIRGLIDNPYGYIVIDDKKIKLCEVEISDITSEKQNGTIVFVNKDLGLVVDNKVIIVKQLQPEGKSIMTARDYRNGAGRNIENKVAQ